MTWESSVGAFQAVSMTCLKACEMTNWIVIGLQAACLLLSGKCGVFHVISASLEWNQPGCFCRTALRPDLPCLLPPVQLHRLYWTHSELGTSDHQSLFISVADRPLSSTFLYWVHLIFSIYSVKHVRVLFSVQRDVVSSIWVTSEQFWEQNQSQNVYIYVLVLTAWLLQAVLSADGRAPSSAVYLFTLLSHVWLRSWLQFSDLGNLCGCSGLSVFIAELITPGEGPGERSLTRWSPLDLCCLAILCCHWACCQKSFCYFTVHVLW